MGLFLLAFIIKERKEELFRNNKIKKAGGKLRTRIH